MSSLIKDLCHREQAFMSKPRLILVGGFLGAGKTTLLAAAAARLTARGRRVGLVANDQAPDLVDTEVFKNAGARVEEVAGGCFCCRFSDLISAMQRLVRNGEADVLLCEPVGSCTDLSATVLQPVKRQHSDEFELAPFTVLLDAKQFGLLAQWSGEREVGSSRFSDEVLYIYRKQIEEADALVVNKADLLSANDRQELVAAIKEHFPTVPVITMSARSGEGVDEWIDFVTTGTRAGTRMAEVDYDIYAAGEAALGWLNASAELRAKSPIAWRQYARELLDAIRGRLRSEGADVAHLKLFLAVHGASIAGNATDNESPVALRGDIPDEQQKVSLVINARVQATPLLLRSAVEDGLRACSDGRVDTKIKNLRSFFPGRPEPTFRMSGGGADVDRQP